MMYSNDIIYLFINVWLLGFYLSCNGSGRSSLHAAIQEARFCHFCGASLPLPRVPGAARGLEWTLSYQLLSVEASLLWCQRKGQFLPSMLGLMSSRMTKGHWRKQPSGPKSWGGNAKFDCFHSFPSCVQSSDVFRCRGSQNLPRSKWSARSPAPAE